MANTEDKKIIESINDEDILSSEKTEIEKRKKEKRKTIIVYIICSILAFSFIGNIVFAVLLNGANNKRILESEANAIELSQAWNRAVALEKNIDQLEDAIDAFEEEIAGLQAEIKELEKYKKDVSEREADLEKKVAELNGVIEQRDKEQEALNERIEQLSKVYSIDVNAQLVLIKEINELLENPPEKVKQFAPEEDTELEYEPATVSLYYLDLKHGYRYGFNADYVYGSASVFKLPYVLSLLKSASADIDAYEGEEEYIPFGFNEEFIYDKTLTQPGSGVIKNGEDGDVYTFLELVEYTIKYSDNVAYREISDKYGYEYLRSYVKDNNIKSMKPALGKLNASDAAIIMKDVYNFINEDQNYGKFLETALCNSSHTVMLSYGVHPKECAHKYGWDENAYHDVALVYDEHPYILVFMSDLHQGGKEVDTYVREIAKKVNLLHENFYKD